MPPCVSGVRTPLRTAAFFYVDECCQKFPKNYSLKNLRFTDVVVYLQPKYGSASVWGRQEGRL